MPFPTAAFKRAVRQHSEPLTVYRRSGASSGMYGQPTEYDELIEPRRLLMSGMEETQQETDAGENQSQRMVVYAAPGVDLRVNDRIEYRNNTYEVLTETGHPSETNTAVYRYELDDV